MDLKARIELVKQPEKIKEALYASSPAVLSFAFEEDPNVRALIAAGAEAIPLIERELKQHGAGLHDISLSCFAYVLAKINVHAAAELLRPLFPALVKRPGAFAAMFVAHALRTERSLTVSSRDLYYAPEQLRETLRAIEQ